jgi:hypothetical protein
MTAPFQRGNPLAEGLTWVARITTIGLEMVLPAILGNWLDSQLGTAFLAVFGLVLGVVGGILHLLFMTRKGGSPDRRSKVNPREQKNRDQVE